MSKIKPNLNTYSFKKSPRDEPHSLLWELCAIFSDIASTSCLNVFVYPNKLHINIKHYTKPFIQIKQK